ncbi:MAG: methionyl-tRNA formyltransferase [Candidatus Levybacteria bacterium]|nr:methionyl-tRNA formyltransferase [Candidatus Levybacteria bacterium]
MKIIFFGTPTQVIPVLEELTKHHEVVAVVTAPDQKVGRKQLLTPPPVKVFAEKHNIPVLQPEKLTDEISQLSTLNSQLYVVAAYGKIIPKKILDIPQYGAINIHPSLLPKYRGSTPIQSTLLDGIKNSGVSFILMDAQMDHGPLLHQIPFAISPTDTFDWLMHNMFSQASIILPSVIQNYTDGKTTAQTQDETQATYTKIITRQDGYIDIDNPPPPDHIERMTRAYYPWPNAWTTVRMKNKELRIKLLPHSSHPELDSGSPILMQMEGKQPVSLKDFINGYPELQTLIQKLFA